MDEQRLGHKTDSNTNSTPPPLVLAQYARQSKTARGMARTHARIKPTRVRKAVATFYQIGIVRRTSLAA